MRIGNIYLCVYMVGMERSLLVTIRRRQQWFAGHVMRKGRDKLVLEGETHGNRQRGRQRGVALDAGCGAVEILRREGGRPCWFQTHGSQRLTMAWHSKRSPSR